MLISIYDFMPLILSMLILLALFILIGIVCALLLKRIVPASLNKFFVGVCSLLGIYIWAVPMKIGFYETFRTLFENI